MDFIAPVIDFLKSDVGVGIITGLLVLSEALGGIPAIKANSVYQLIVGVLAKIARKPTV